MTKFTNNTSTFSTIKLNKENTVKLDKENWKMLKLSKEYIFYKEILKILLTNFIIDLQESEMIKFIGEERPTDEWCAELFLDKNLTFIPVIEENKCYIKNIINSEKIICYNYSDISDLTLQDCYDKMINDLKGLYNDDCYE